MENDTNLNEEEILAFNKLRNDLKAPIEMKKRVTESLTQLKLIKETNMKRLHIYWAAASITALICGLFIGNTFNNQTLTTTNMKQYALFLYENESFESANDQDLVEEYTNWAISMSEAGKLSGAEKLASSGQWLGNLSMQNSSSKLEGYFIINANSFDEALDIAREHPHINYGGGVEVRPIEVLN